MKVKETIISQRGAIVTQIIEFNNTNEALFKRFITSNQDDDKVLVYQPNENTIYVWYVNNGIVSFSRFEFGVNGNADIYWLPNNSIELKKGKYVSSIYEANFELFDVVDNLEVVNKKLSLLK